MGQLVVTTNSSQEYSEFSEVVYTWNGYAESGKVKSILRFIETSADEFRTAYLTFIESLGQSKNQGIRLSDLFQIHEGPSLWWMSLLAEKSPYKSPRIKDCIRLLALEKIFDIHQPSEVVLAIDDWQLASAIKILCQRRGIEFTWNKQSTALRSKVFQIFRVTPLFVKCRALTYLLFYFCYRWVLRKPTLNRKVTKKNSIFFASYFFNIDLELAQKGIYYSRQWGDLPTFLQAAGWNTCHLEFFIKSPDIKNPSKAKTVMADLLMNRENRTHYFTDQYLSLRMFFQVIGDYFSVHKKMNEVRNAKEYFNVPNSKVNLWCLLEEDWCCSFSGKTVVQNLILTRLISSHVSDLPFQSLGFYLCENMGWERALIHAWKQNNHGTLIAVPHSTIRFWDLRYSSVRWLEASAGELAQPHPDAYAVNGEMARSALLRSGVPKAMLRNVEALRYSFLERHIRNASTVTGGEVSYRRKSPRVLVLGDFTDRQTDQMLKMLESVVLRFGIEADVCLKPHPVCGVTISDYPSLKGRQTMQPLQDMVGDYDLIFGSNVTTASLDCFLMGGKTIVFLDDCDLNNSPLRGVRGVQFVSNVDELYNSLTETSADSAERVVADFFWIDPSMSRWQGLISEFTEKSIDLDVHSV